MSLDKVTLTELVKNSFDGRQLTEKNKKRMLNALWKKYWKKGLDSFREKIVLSSFILYPNSKEARATYTQEVLKRLGLIKEI